MIIKLKTCKSLLKRVKIKKKLLYHKCAYKSHLLSNKTNKRLRRLSKIKIINNSDKKRLLRLLPYI